MTESYLSNVMKSHEITCAKPRYEKQEKFGFSMEGSLKVKYILELEYIPFLIVVQCQVLTQDR